MIFHLDTWFEDIDKHGNKLSCLRLEFKATNESYRDKIRDAITEALHGKPEVTEKSSAIGFHQSVDGED